MKQTFKDLVISKVQTKTAVVYTVTRELEVIICVANMPKKGKKDPRDTYQSDSSGEAFNLQ